MYSWADATHTGEVRQHEPLLSAELCDRLGADTVFYDIGGRFGYFARLALNAGVAPGAIYTFDAYPLHYYFLRKNCKSGGINTVFAQLGATDDRNQTAIDEFVRSNPGPDIVKIDVEGAEHEVLQGMAQLLGDSSPDVYVELHPELLADRGTDVSAVTSLLADAGLELTVTDHRSEEASWQPFDSSSLPEGDTFLVRASAPT